MSVNILMISQEKIGDALLNSAKKTFEALPEHLLSVPIDFDDDPDAVVNIVSKIISTEDNHDGILMLTDMYGSTPCNIANRLQDIAHVPVRVVTGLNLPMLMRVINYHELPLDELTEKAVSGGRDGVKSDMNCDKEC